MADNDGYVHHEHIYPDIKNEDDNRHRVEMNHEPHDLFIEMDELILVPIIYFFDGGSLSRHKQSFFI